LLTTLRHAFNRPYTVQYPEERPTLPLGWRGRPRLIYDVDTGDLRCVACNACAIACPVGVIKIESEMGPDRKKILHRFDLDMAGCIQCALCVEACPFKALVMAPEFEFSGYDRQLTLVYDKEQLRIPGTPEIDRAREFTQGALKKAGAPAGERPAPAAAAAARPAAPAAQCPAAPGSPAAREPAAGQPPRPSREASTPAPSPGADASAPASDGGGASDATEEKGE